MAMMLIDQTKDTACKTAEADVIRAKTGGSTNINYDYENNKGFADAIAAIPSGGGLTVSEVKTIVQNSRSSGSATIVRVTYNNYSSGTSGIGCISNSVANGSTNTNNHTALFDGTYIVIHVGYALNNITYNGQTATFTKYGSSAQWDVHITLPANYDDSIPFVFS